MYNYTYITYCCILTILICTTDAIRICPSNVTSASTSDPIGSSIVNATSGTIESAIVNSTNSEFDTCILMLLVPALSMIEFTVIGDYRAYNSVDGGCENAYEYLRLVTPDGTTELCGTRADNEVLASYYNDKESEYFVTFEFETPFATADQAPSFLIFFNVSRPDMTTDLSPEDSTKSAEIFNILIGSGVALAVIIVVIVVVRLSKKRKEKSLEESTAGNGTHEEGPVLDKELSEPTASSNLLHREKDHFEAPQHKSA